MNHNFLSTKKLIFIFLPLVVAFVLLLLNSTFSPKKQLPPNPTPLVAFPTRFITQSQTNQEQPVVRYQKSGVDAVVDRINNPQPLSKSDQQAKQALLSQLQNKSGTLQTTTMYRIEYIQAPDQFMVEIRSTDVTTAKEEASLWLETNGLSKRAQCIMPVVFYLDTQTTAKLRSSTLRFNPMPEGCSI